MPKRGSFFRDRVEIMSFYWLGRSEPLLTLAATRSIALAQRLYEVGRDSQLTSETLLAGVITLKQTHPSEAVQILERLNRRNDDKLRRVSARICYTAMADREKAAALADKPIEKQIVCSSVIGRAEEAADEMRQRFGWDKVSTGLLLWALAKDPDSQSAKAMASCGVTADEILDCLTLGHDDRFPEPLTLGQYFRRLHLEAGRSHKCFNKLPARFQALLEQAVTRSSDRPKVATGGVVVLSNKVIDGRQRLEIQVPLKQQMIEVEIVSGDPLTREE